MKRISFLLLLFIISTLLSCSKDNDPVVVPASTLNSNNGVLIELEWTTGGSSSQAINESDLDLYLDLNEAEVDASMNSYTFEALHLKDVYRDGIYDIYVGAIDVSRRTDYMIYISAPGGGVIHRFDGYFLAGDEGEVPYLRIQKQGSRYTLLDQ